MTILLNNDQLITVNDHEFQIENSFIVCVETDTREGLLIPIHSISMIYDNKKHKKED